MLVYPTGASAWAFLKHGLPSEADGASLRFIIRHPLPRDLARLDPSVARLVDENAERYREIQQYIRSNPVQQDSKSINLVFRDLFQIEYSRLIAQNEPNKNPASNVFFLSFIPAGCEKYEKDDTKRMTLRHRVSKEHDLFIDFLDANGAEEIYSLQAVDSIEPENDGAWEYFVHNVKSGQIIVSLTAAMPPKLLSRSIVSRCLHSARSDAQSRKGTPPGYHQCLENIVDILAPGRKTPPSDPPFSIWWRGSDNRIPHPLSAQRSA